jgi:hypothetical protein
VSIDQLEVVKRHTRKFIRGGVRIGADRDPGCLPSSRTRSAGWPSRSVGHGVHNLTDKTAAQIEAIKLARSVRAARPELVGKHCSITVTDEQGAAISVIPLEIA